MKSNPETERLTVLTQDSYHHLMQTMLAALPRRVTDQPEEIVRRENAAIAEVASMRPGNASEAALAVMCVTASEHAMDILSRVPHRTPDAPKYLTMAGRMLRESHATLSLLCRVQAARRAREGGKTATDRVRLARPAALDRTNEGAGTVVAGGQQGATGASKHAGDNGAGPRPAGRLSLGQAALDDFADEGHPPKATRVLH